MHEFQLSERLRLFPKISAILKYLQEFQSHISVEDVVPIEAAIRLLQGLEHELLNPEIPENLENLLL